MDSGITLNIPSLALGALYIFLGYKIRKADRQIVIVTIILNLLQVINFNLASIGYVFAFGPHIQIDVMDWNFLAGLDANFWIRLGPGSGTPIPFFKISLINLALVIYLLDQIRFVPKKVEQPWEAEFME